MARWWMAVALLGTALGTSRAQDEAPPGGEVAAAWHGGPPGHAAPPDGWHANFAPGPEVPPPSPPEGPPRDCPPPPAGVECVDVGVECKTGPYVYASAEYLRWWVRKRMVPPLLNAGSVSDPIPGAIGQPATVPVLGRTFDNDNGHNGGRFTLGTWIAGCDWATLEGTFFILEQRSDPQTFVSDGGPQSLLLARPFFNVSRGLEDADPISVPNVQGGSITFGQPRRLLGGETNLRVSSAPSIFAPLRRCSLLLGGRYLALDEDFIVTETVFDLPGLGSGGNLTTLGENFTTYNRFYGGQLGAEVEACFGGLSVIVTNKFALGYTDQEARVSGLTAVAGTLGPAVANDRALLVQPSNVGSYRREEFAAVYEFDFNLAYTFTDCIRVNLGYTFLYLTDVLRPGDQLDRNVTLQPLPQQAVRGQALPLFPMRSSNFWAQGLNVGLQLSY